MRPARPSWLARGSGPRGIPPSPQDAWGSLHRSYLSNSSQSPEESVHFLVGGVDELRGRVARLVVWVDGAHVRFQVGPCGVRVGKTLRRAEATQGSLHPVGVGSRPWLVVVR